MIRWIVLFCVLEASVAGLLYHLTLTKQQQHLQKHVTMLETAYTAVKNSYLLTTETLYHEAVHRSEILDIVREGVESEGSARDSARGKLYRRLYSTYRRLRARNLNQFHFHLADGTSFLRFHRPEHYGDPLFEVRPSLRIANQEQRPVFGFELGRIHSGFRYVFPIMDGAKHLGSVETSLSFQAIEEELAKVVPDARFSLILQKQAVFAMLSDTAQSIYKPSLMHPEYVSEDLQIDDPELVKPVDALVLALNHNLTQHPDIMEAMNAGRPLAVETVHAGEDYAVTLVPVKDVVGKAVGYLVAYTPDPLLRIFVHEFRWQLFFASVALLLLIFFMYRNAKSRHALRESQLMFSGMFNYAPVGISLLDTEGYYLRANTLFLDLVGYSWKELEKMRCLEINHPDYVEMSEQLLKRITAGEIKQWNEDKRFLRKDGSVFWGNHWLAALDGEDGNCIALICIITDLTERKQAEAVLHKLSRAVEQSYNTIAITDLEGDLEFVNPAFTRTSGYSTKEVIGRNPRILKSGEQSREFYEELWQTLLKGKTWHGEFHNKRKNGELYWESAIISPLKDDEGHTTHYMAIKQDITERKHAEQELHRKNAELTRLNQEKNEFMGIAAHDLKNPLSAIKGLSEEIGEDCEEMTMGEVKEDAEKICLAAQRMFMLITNLLDVNAIESGKININPALEDIPVLMANTVKDYRDRAAHKNISLHFDNQAGQCSIWLDGEVFLQIMDNLVSNAIKYSPPGTTTEVRVSLQGEWVRCEIQDQGPGLSEEDQAKLFGKFARLSAQPTGNEHSTGLGLFIVKKMVEAMHGRVWCESVLGRGSNFIVEFPVKSEHEN